MANNVVEASGVVEDAVEVRTNLLNNGYIRIYDGTQPAGPGTAITSQVLLAELRFGATAFGAAVAGVATANAITADASANATGTATWARLLQSDGTTAVVDCSVDTASADIILDSVSIIGGNSVTITSLTFTQPV